jgi:RNA polymerase sigma-70 factor (ECF subfamily)
MAMGNASDITGLLVAWSDGDAGALDQLVPLVEHELQQLAHHYMSREPAGHPLQTTAVVNEAFVRLIGGGRIRWQNRTHFFAVSARVMRRILVDVARSRRNQKRGGGAVLIALDDAPEVTQTADADLIAVNDALTGLAAIDARKSQAVELRFFGGLTIAETAAVLGVSPVTVTRDWDFARAWLARELRRPDDHWSLARDRTPLSRHARARPGRT